MVRKQGTTTMHFPSRGEVSDHPFDIFCLEFCLGSIRRQNHRDVQMPQFVFLWVIVSRGFGIDNVVVPKGLSLSAVPIDFRVAKTTYLEILAD